MNEEHQSPYLAAIIRETKKHLMNLQTLNVDYISKETLTGTMFCLAGVKDKQTLLDNESEKRQNCQLCKLSEKRNNVVYGEGNPDADLMFIGEGPGENEDRTGRPFVGKAGQLLDKIIGAMTLKREDVYIANIVKCRPPGNRNPEPDEMTSCIGFLKKQIAIIEPTIIVTLGAVATKALLETEERISAMRGKFVPYGSIQVMPTYHPAYLLHNEHKKKETWSDMKKVMKALELS